MRAIDVIGQLTDFYPGEFPPLALENTEARVLTTLQRFRTVWGRSVHPSRHPDGWARFKGSKTSRHYAVGRLSDAADFFPAGNVFSAWLLAQEFFSGVGIYFDTRRNALQPGPMLHGDMRTDQLLWCRVEGVYYYLTDTQGQMAFLNAMSDYLKTEIVV